MHKQTERLLRCSHERSPIELAFAGEELARFFSRVLALTVQIRAGASAEASVLLEALG
jgi:hypothetical protein